MSHTLFDKETEDAINLLLERLAYEPITSSRLRFRLEESDGETIFSGSISPEFASRVFIRALDIMDNLPPKETS